MYTITWGLIIGGASPPPGSYSTAMCKLLCASCSCYPPPPTSPYTINLSNYITQSHCPCTITLHTIPQTSHWVTIFAALGEDYTPFHPYTLTDFALYNIYEHSDIIFEICHDAMQEEKLRIRVGPRHFLR